MAEHHFHLKATWQGGLQGEGQISVGNLQSEVSVPLVMNGPGVGTNPDEMLVGAAATCYLITLASVLENRKLMVSELTLESEGIVIMEGHKPRFHRIIHRPVIVLAHESSEEQLRDVAVLAERAEKACMISKAIRGNVEVSVEANVVVRV
ncbi:SACOL1771 family peroxiredoxin [Aneurinibacillus sp. REN35]|uniref:SACOL1771 family peroxiredoxin n=1 Tax=Aneurinibacillus sp. REN35 TaxID=3237286 RepID=UPI003528CD4F